MRITLRSVVNGNFKDVYKAFDRLLFEFLLPPGAKVIRFDGSARGNIVHLTFSFPLYSEWISEITEENELEDHCYFIDEGRKVPLGITFWKHKHVVRKDDNRSVIEDHIEFSTGNKLLDLIYYPGLFLAFSPRKRLYQKYFNK